MSPHFPHSLPQARLAIEPPIELPSRGWSRVGMSTRSKSSAASCTGQPNSSCTMHVGRYTAGSWPGHWLPAFPLEQQHRVSSYSYIPPRSYRYRYRAAASQDCETVILTLTRCLLMKSPSSIGLDNPNKINSSFKSGVTSQRLSEF